MNWFNGKRQKYIAELLHVVGFVNRSHLIRKFGIPQAQAAIDLRDFLKANPGRMVYDASRKVYVARKISRRDGLVYGINQGRQILRAADEAMRKKP